MAGTKKREIIFEYLSLGKIVRVTAVDAATGVEVMFQAPVNTPPTDLKRIAISKLDYVINKRRSSGQHS